jgi:hypothetical protein
MFVQPFTTNSKPLLSEEIIRGWGGTLFDHMALDLDDLIDEDFNCNDSDKKNLRDLETCKTSYNDVQHKCMKVLNNHEHLLLWLDVFRVNFKFEFLNLFNVTDCGREIANIAQKIKDCQPGSNYEDEVTKLWNKKLINSTLCSGSNENWPYLNTKNDYSEISNFSSMITTSELSSLVYIFEKNFNKNYNHKYFANISFSKHFMLGFHLLENKSSHYTAKHDRHKKETEADSSSDEEFNVIKGGKESSKKDLNLSYKSVL